MFAEIVQGPAIIQNQVFCLLTNDTSINIKQHYKTFTKERFGALS